MATMERTDRLRIGVVGVNERIRRVILKGLAASPRATVAAVCSRSAEKAAGVAAEFGAEPFTDYGAMLQHGSIDAVFVETPPELHYPMALAAIAAGKHVACEKPLASSVQQAREMEQAARAAGVRTAVNFTYRSANAQRHFASVLAAGEVGELLHFTIGYWQARQLFPETPIRGALDDLGPHCFDLVRWWAGAAGAGDIAAICSLEGGGPELPASLQPVYHAALRLTGGATGIIQISRVAVGYQNAVVASFQGRQGAVAMSFDFGEGAVSVARPGEGRREGRWAVAPTPPEMALAYDAFPAYHLDRIVGALRGEEEFPGFVEGRRAQEVVEAATVSSAEARWVAIPGARP